MHDYDKSSKWLIQHHGDSILRLAGVLGFSAWRPLQAELVQPRQLPDGVLEVQFANAARPDIFILELATYPEERLYEQVARDLMLVWLDRRVLPEALVVIFHPRGSLGLSPELTMGSPRGLSRCQLGWKVVELWNVSADELLSTGDLGVIPWVPLARLSQPVENVFQECRDRIDREATVDERANLLAVTQIMARLRYNEPRYLSILGGSQMLMESPLIQELMAKRTQRDILRCLTARLGDVPTDVGQRIEAIFDEVRLDNLMTAAATCANWEELRSRLIE